MKALADPTGLKPLKKKEGLLQIIIETPAGSPKQIRIRPGSKDFCAEESSSCWHVFPHRGSAVHSSPAHRGKADSAIVHLFDLP
jgi:hypothetical protein